MRMQIPRTQKARLRRMRMNPAKHHQLLTIHILKQRPLINHITRITRALLVGDYEMIDKDPVLDNSAAEDAACLEVVRGVLVRVL